MKLVLLFYLTVFFPTPVWTRQLPRYTGRETIRIGGADAPDHSTFTSQPILITDRNGAVYARVAAESRIVVFDSTGRFLRTIGRQGQGPGEFTSPQGHGFLGDTLWVTDWPTPRLSRFHRDGTHLNTERSDPPALQTTKLAGPQGITAFLSSGRALYIPGSVLIEPPGRVSLPVLIGPTDMRSVDTVALVSRPEGLLLVGVGTLWIYPFPAPPLIAISPDGSGFLIARWDDTPNTPLQVQRFNSQGHVVWRQRLSLPSPIIPRRVRDSITAVAITRARPHIESARRRSTTPTLMPTAESLVIDGLVLPKYYPPANRLVAGADGTTWIRTARAEGRDDIWMVLTSSGVPEAEVLVSRGIDIHQATRRILWGTTTDPDGVHYIVKLVVER